MKRLLVTAGPTHEAIDAVRYIANRSSGRMGIALAEAGRAAGWDVTLLLGPVHAAPPDAIRTERFISTEDLRRLLDAHFPQCDLLIMAAAVADFTPAQTHAGKLPRRPDRQNLELIRTPDLVAGCAARRQPHQRIVGFALEEADQLHQRARTKLSSKKLDAIVANALDTMDSDSISASILTPDGVVHTPPTSGPIHKSDFADWFIRWMDGNLLPGMRP